MKVTVVNTIKQFEEIKSIWDSVYAADMNASVFVAWDFIRGWIDHNKNKWMVLVARPDDRNDYKAFLFLINDKNGRVLKTCDSALADHSSFVSFPEYEKDAVHGFAYFLQEQLSWERLELLEVMDRRLDFFLECFSHRKYHMKELERTVRPYIPLENSWNKYLLEHLTQKKRSKLRKLLKNIELQEELNIIDIKASAVESHIETLLRFWQMKWGEVSPSRLENLLSIFQYCFENNHLIMPILWSRNKPVGAHVSFVDHEKKCISNYIGGWDYEYSKLSPGNTLIAYEIRFAIENKLVMYDFLRGDEDYKRSSFGAIKRYNRNVVIKRKSLKSMIRGVKKRFRR